MTGLTRFSRIIPPVSFAARMILGVIFLYAGAVKIIDPSGFARDISNYRILPDLLVNTCAVVLPWIEAISGLSLILGMGIEGGALLIGSLLTVFFIALSSSLIRGLDISCGCFSTSPEAHRITWTFLVRDLSLLAMAGLVFFQDTGIGSMSRIASFFSSSRKHDRA
jgi:uncharacterized membrane protein YphA (DoxX/SURF4 family)